MKTYPYSFHIALDGNGINGLEGMAGMCLFHFDPADNSYAYKVKYYDGASAGHACMVSPDGKHGYLGNAGQHLLFYDAGTIEEQHRISTLRYEANDSTIRGSTHVVWLNNKEVLTAVGDYFYRFSVDSLDKGERLMPHDVKLPHGMKVSASGRYLAYGSMDNPAFGTKGEAREIGILDLVTGDVTHLPMPTTCWHIVAHPKKDLFYAVSFRVLPQDNVNYHEWAMAFLKEYAYEIDPVDKRISRHWSTSRETPAHINSDITISDTELMFCNGGSQTIVCIDLETFSKYRVIDERPSFLTQVKNPRQVGTQIYDVLARGGLFNSSKHLLDAMRVSRFTFMDSIYACQLSKDQSLLFTANRGLNHITVYNYPEATIRIRVQMPDLHEFMPLLTAIADPRLGFHHSYLISPQM
jgi:hypothetical protein